MRLGPVARGRPGTPLGAPENLCPRLDVARCTEHRAAEQAQCACAEVPSLGLGRARHLASLSTSVLALMPRAALEQRAFEQAPCARAPDRVSGWVGHATWRP
jgi:hypothetical protein